MSPPQPPPSMSWPDPFDLVAHAMANYADDLWDSFKFPQASTAHLANDHSVSGAGHPVSVQPLADDSD